MKSEQDHLDAGRPEPASTIGTELALLRIARGWHEQQQLARASGMPKSSISEYERGKRKPELKTVAHLVHAMGFGLGALDHARTFLLALTTEGTAEFPREHSTWTRIADRIATRVGAFVFGHASNTRTPNADDRAEAPLRLERLQKHAFAAQKILVRDMKEFQDWALCELLCLRSADLAGALPERSRELAQLAVLIADHIDVEEPFKKSLRAFAYAHLGNAERVCGSLAAAENAFRTSENCQKDWSRGGLLEGARVLAMKASLRAAQERQEEALTLLDASLKVSTGAPLVGSILLNRARLLDENGQSDAAISLLSHAALFIDPEEDSRLWLMLRHNSLLYLTNGGRYGEAQAIAAEVRALCRRIGTNLDRIRLQWVEARLAAEIGDTDHAIETYAHVRGEFASLGINYDMALVTLELAALYAKEGRVGEVKTLARHLVPIFKAHDVHQGALAALALFRQAAEREEVTVELARSIGAYLVRARHNPELRFEAAGTT